MDIENKSSRFDKPVLQWAKAIVWCLVYLLFIVWVGTYWWLILLPVVFDAFVTKFIPWTWWKKSQNKTVQTVMGWVDAIVFALVAVYFINTYLFQNYQIPTSSLEKSLLVGDFLFVSKASYGPRVPNTPLSFPLVQHTLPILNCKSFVENPQWDYKRLKGFDEIERNDIVVFNFPTGDTVALKVQNPDYYTSCYLEGYNTLIHQNPGVKPNVDDCYAVGRQIVRSNVDRYGEIVYRPVDRRENYVKRCVGIPDDWIQIKQNQLFVNHKPQERISGLEFNYFVQTDGSMLKPEMLSELGVSNDDVQFYNAGQYVNEFAQIGLDGTRPIYHFPLTDDMLVKLKATSGVAKVVIEQPYTNEVFPLGANTNWTRDNYGPLWVPKKGKTLRLNKYNLAFYERIIRVYEHNTLDVRGNDFYVNGKPTKSYTFKMDYYWMMGDNRHNSADSRYWGFVPEDHIVGRPVVVWLSLNKDKSWFGGKIRFNRFFKFAEH